MKRGIAGSLIFTIFDKDPLDVLMEKQELYYWKKASDRANPSDTNSISLINGDNSDAFTDTRPAQASYDDQLYGLSRG